MCHFGKGQVFRDLDAVATAQPIGGAEGTLGAEVIPLRIKGRAQIIVRGRIERVERARMLEMADGTGQEALPAGRYPGAGEGSSAWPLDAERADEGAMGALIVALLQQSCAKRQPGFLGGFGACGLRCLAPGRRDRMRRNPAPREQQGKPGGQEQGPCRRGAAPQFETLDFASVARSSPC